MIDPNDIDQSEVEKTIEEMAQQVVKRRLEAPAVLFLEMNRPLSFLGSQALVIATPLLGPLFGPQKMARLSKLLSKRENLDALISRIEQLTRQRDEEEKATGQAKEETE